MLRDELQRLIQYGVKQREIARRAGVSEKTITNLLYEDYNTLDYIEEKVWKAIREIKNGIAGIDSDK